MTTQTITGEDFTVLYDAVSGEISFQGELSLSGAADYKPINTLLDEVAATDPPTMTLNVKELSFLNSSGISMLSKFVMSLRKKPNIQLIIVGSQTMPWQNKSLKNLQKFLPSIQLAIE